MNTSNPASSLLLQLPQLMVISYSSAATAVKLFDQPVALHRPNCLTGNQQDLPVNRSSACHQKNRTEHHNLTEALNQMDSRGVIVRRHIRRSHVPQPPNFRCRSVGHTRRSCRQVSSPADSSCCHQAAALGSRSLARHFSNNLDPPSYQACISLKRKK